MASTWLVAALPTPVTLVLQFYPDLQLIFLPESIVGIKAPSSEGAFFYASRTSLFQHDYSDLSIINVLVCLGEGFSTTVIVCVLKCRF